MRSATKDNPEPSPETIRQDVQRPVPFAPQADGNVWIAENDANSGDLPRWQAEDGRCFIAFFNSEQAFRQANGGVRRCRSLPLREFVMLAAGEMLYCNPGLSDARLVSLEDTLTAAGDGVVTYSLVNGGDTLLISSVEPPAALVTSLCRLFSQHKAIRRAWLAKVRETPQRQMNLLIAIEAEGDIEPVIHAAGKTAMASLSEDETVDICQLTPDSPQITHCFNVHITPFYTRRFGSFLRNMPPGNIR